MGKSGLAPEHSISHWPPQLNKYYKFRRIRPATAWRRVHKELSNRLKILENLELPEFVFKVPSHENGLELFEAVKQLGREGIVSKRDNSHWIETRALVTTGSRPRIGTGLSWMCQRA